MKNMTLKETKKDHSKKIWKLENFDGNREDERNFGHTKDEWGSMPHNNKEGEKEIIGNRNANKESQGKHSRK